MEPDGLHNIVVFTGDLNLSVRTGIAALLDAFPEAQIEVLLHRPSKSKATLIRNQFRNLKRHGLRWIPYQAGEILAALTGKPEPTATLPFPRPAARYEPDALEATGRVRIVRFASINGEKAEAHIKALNPDLGVSLAAPILKPNVFALPRLGTINLHKGKLPDYRGMPPAFWEMLNEEDQVGCTVHRVEAGLDTGAILAEGSVRIEPYSTPSGLRIALDSLGNVLAIQAATALAEGTAVPRPQTGDGRTNSRPPLGLERRFARALERRAGLGGAKGFVKDGILNLFSVKNRILPPSREASTAILLYHRVSDEFRDSVTIGVEQFDRHMAYLKKHCAVVPLRALVRGEARPERGPPLVAVTFDDGYLDNYQNAAPVLLKHRLPCTFFVSTDKIENGTAFQHDLDKLGRGLPNMNWDQIREMQRDGLDFGSHTVNHANLAKLSEEEIRRELVESREALRRELGHEEFLFAYPFGKRGDITERARELVREAGFACCCAAYGGINYGEIDLFNILRFGVNYSFTLAALRSRLSGYGG